jgi:sec-independent protein translocase protein TatB
MFDMSWGEVMLIGGVALIVIGPKDLPKALRTVGQVTTKLRRMAGEFQMQFNEAIREAELDEVRKEVDGIRNTARSASTFNPVQTIRDELKGAVEGRAKTTEIKTTEIRTNETDAADVGASDVPAVADAAPQPMGPHRPADAPQAETRSLADATAQLKAEQGAGSAPPPGHEAPPQGAVQVAADEPPLPVPGSVDDPFGTPPEPAAAEPAKHGTVAR